MRISSVALEFRETLSLDSGTRPSVASSTFHPKCRSRGYNSSVDPHTLEKLEFDRVRELLAAEARCSLGRERALRVAPTARRPELVRWLAQLKQLRDLFIDRGMPPFAGIHDIRELVHRATPTSPLAPPDYADIGRTLAGMADL